MWGLAGWLTRWRWGCRGLKKRGVVIYLDSIDYRRRVLIRFLRMATCKTNIGFPLNKGPPEQCLKHDSLNRIDNKHESVFLLDCLR